MLPHSDGNQAWQSWISLERQVRNANEYEYEYEYEYIRMCMSIVVFL